MTELPTSETAITFQEAGSGPAIVLLHPTGLGPPPLNDLAGRLAVDHRVIVPARRGYGQSDGGTPPTSLDDHIDDLAGMLQRLGLASATFVGVSAGATIVLALGLRRPELIDAGVAHEPLIGPLAPGLHDAVSQAIDQMLTDPDPRAVSTFVVGLVGVDTWNRLPGSWRSGVERQAGATRAEAPLYPAFTPTEADLHQLATRDIVASVGARSGPLRQDAAAVLRAVGIATPTVADARHLAPVENPGGFVELVTSITHRAGVG